MTGIMENNVVILHNVNAFGENRHMDPAYVPVFGFSDARCDDWTKDNLEAVFAIGNGVANDEWSRGMVKDYYAQKIRSLSVSDVVVLNGVHYRCESAGWKVIESC